MATLDKVLSPSVVVRTSLRPDVLPSRRKPLIEVPAFVRLAAQG